MWEWILKQTCQRFTSKGKAARNLASRKNQLKLLRIKNVMGISMKNPRQFSSWIEGKKWKREKREWKNVTEGDIARCTNEKRKICGKWTHVRHTCISIDFYRVTGCAFLEPNFGGKLRKVCASLAPSANLLCAVIRDLTTKNTRCLRKRTRFRKYL